MTRSTSVACTRRFWNGMSTAAVSVALQAGRANGSIEVHHRMPGKIAAAPDDRALSQLSCKVHRTKASSRRASATPSRAVARTASGRVRTVCTGLQNSCAKLHKAAFSDEPESVTQSVVRELARQMGGSILDYCADHFNQEPQVESWDDERDNHALRITINLKIVTIWL
jgi:hypothetical protein